MNASLWFRAGLVKSVKVSWRQQNNIKLISSVHQRNFAGVRPVSTLQTKTGQQQHVEEGLIKRVLKKIPFLNLHKSKLQVAGHILYEEIADKVNYVDFFEQLDLRDTFYSWFVVTELHIWMVSARAMAEGDDGRLIRNSLLVALWQDVAQRVKHLGAHNPSAVKIQIVELSEQLQAALIAYDEGLQSDDVVLAGALWRRFYQQEDVDPVCLEALVKYVRKQIRLLDNLPIEELVTKKKINWTSLKI